MISKEPNNNTNEYRFGTWLFDTVTLTLFSCKDDGIEEVLLDQVSKKLLTYLLQNQNRIVSRSELLENVWSVTGVTDDRVTRAISVLRTILVDDIKEPQFIQTIPKRGYKFIYKSQGNKKFAMGKPILVTLLAALIILCTFTFFYFIDEKKITKLSQTPFYLQAHGMYYPSLNKTGDLLLYATGKIQSKSPILTSELVIKDLNNHSYKVIKNISERYFWGASWTKNNNELIYFIFRPEEICEAWILKIEEATLNVESDRKLFDCSPKLIYARTMTFSKNGRYFFYNDAAQKSKNMAIFRYDILLGQKQQITAPENDSVGDFYVESSNTSDEVLFLRMSVTSESELWVFNNQTLEQKYIHKSISGAQKISWAPEGDDFIYLTRNELRKIDRDMLSEEIVMKIDIPTDETSNLYWFFSPDFSEFYKLNSIDSSTVTVAAPNPFTLTAQKIANPYLKLSDSLNIFKNPIFGQPDITVEHNNGSTIISINEITGKKHEISRIKSGITDYIFEFSPNGKEFLISDNNDLWWGDLSGKTKYLNKPDQVLINPSWSNISGVVYAVDKKIDMQLVEFDLYSGEFKVIEYGVRNYKRSPDGSIEVKVKSNSNTVLLNNQITEESIELPMPDFTNKKELKFIFYEKYLYVKCSLCNIKGSETGQLLLRYDINSGISETKILPVPGYNNLFSISSDGNTFYLDSTAPNYDSRLTSFKLIADDQ